MPRAFTDTERHHVRERLRAAAATRVAEVGFRRCTVGDLARDAGISKGAFYAFYDSKEALFVELLRDTEARLREDLAAAAAREGRPGEVLRAVLDRLRSAVTEHPLMRVLTDPEESAALFRGLPPTALAEAQADDDRWFTELFSGLAARGVIAGADVERLVAIPRLFFAIAQGRSWLGGDQIGRAHV